MRTIRTDVLVIGSGFGGAAPALRLAQAGMQVQVVEKGEAIGIRDFRQTQDPRYLKRFIRGLSGDHVGFTYAEALGGGSGFYEMVSLRAPSRAFSSPDGEGRALWPKGLDRAAFDPWYEMAERMLHVEQIGEDEVPKSGLVFSLLMKNLGLSCDRARYAVKGCLGSGFCVTGCIYGAKQSLHLNYLPQAVDAGATIDCNLAAVRIEPRPGRPRRYHVYCQSSSGEREWRRYEARMVILAGGTVGTAALLLASRPTLAPMSPALGRHICVNGGVKVAALLPERIPDGDMFAGRSHPGMISYHYLESHGITISAVKALPVQAVTAARFRLDGDPREPAWWGEANVDLMRRFRHRLIALTSFGLTPPGARLTMLPQGPALDMPPTPALVAYEAATRALLESILVRNGCRLVRTDWIDRTGRPHEGLYFSTAHQTGSARMADDAIRGVVNSDGEVFGNPGVYVTDGAAIPSSLAVNTSLTILANAERIAAGIVDKVRR
jgi:choline dehydrogenase-like flavoprotein